MTVEAAPDRAVTTPEPGAIHPAWLRVTHWINAAAMAIMIGSGWEIYNASPLFAFRFPRELTLGGWLGGTIVFVHGMRVLKAGDEPAGRPVPRVRYPEKETRAGETR